MRRQLAVLTLLALGAGAPLMAQQAPQGSVPEPSVSETFVPVASPAVFARSWLDMPEVDPGSFPMFRREVLATVSRGTVGGGGGAVGAREWLDYARVMFNGGLFPEAMGGLEQAITLGVVSDPDLRRHAALLALGLEAADRGPCRCGGLVPRTEAAGSFFAELLDLSQSATPDISRIAALRDALAHQAPAVTGFVGPILFETARRAGDADLSGALLDHVAAAAARGGGTSRSALLRMRGELAELRGQEAEAFGYYVDTLGFHDGNAFLARLRIADMAIRTRDSAALEVVRDFLIEGLQEWHGGEAGLAMMTRLAAVSEALLDAPAALETMARIRGGYPGTPQARLAGERAEIILRSHMQALDEGQVSTAAYAALIRRLRGGLADLQAWIPARTALARAFERDGLMVAAAAEYGAIREDLRLYGPLGARVGESELLRHHLRLLAAAGYGTEARAAVATAGPLLAQDRALREQALSVMDGAALNIHLGSAPDRPLVGAEHLLAARIRFAEGGMATAVREWQAYAAGGGRLSGADAADFVFAKYKAEAPPQIALDAVTQNERVFLDVMVRALAAPKTREGRLDRGQAQAVLDEAAAAAEMAASATEWARDE